MPLKPLTPGVERDVHARDYDARPGEEPVAINVPVKVLPKRRNEEPGFCINPAGSINPMEPGASQVQLAIELVLFGTPEERRREVETDKYSAAQPLLYVLRRLYALDGAARSIQAAAGG